MNQTHLATPHDTERKKAQRVKESSRTCSCEARKHLGTHSASRTDRRAPTFPSSQAPTLPPIPPVGNSNSKALTVALTPCADGCQSRSARMPDRSESNSFFLFFSKEGTFKLLFIGEFRCFFSREGERSFCFPFTGGKERRGGGGLHGSRVDRVHGPRCAREAVHVPRVR